MINVFSRRTLAAFAALTALLSGVSAACSARPTGTYQGPGDVAPKFR